MSEEDTPERPDKNAAAARFRDQHRWVDLQIQEAMARGDFDDLPGAGKPIEGLGENHDPDWWLKKLIEREKISVLPPALELRKEDLQIEARLDRENTETAVRKVLEDFNRRIIQARRQLEGGPPVITPLRDIDAEILAWRGRRDARRAEQALQLAAQVDPRRRRWFRRNR